MLFVILSAHDISFKRYIYRLYVNSYLKNYFANFQNTYHIMQLGFMGVFYEFDI